MEENDFRSGVIRPVECFREGWELIKDEYWMVFAVTILGLMIGGVVPVFLSGPMICGIYYCLLRKMNGGRIEIEGLFKGFEYFLPSVLVSALVTIPVFVVFAGMYVPMIALAVSGARMSQEEFFAFLAATVAAEVVFGFLMVCLHTLLMFAFPLIVDKKMSAGRAMKTSARAVWANLGGVVGLFAVGFVLCIIGYLILCVGIYLVIPIVIVGNLVAYRKIFPPAPPENFNAPPAPDAFRGAGDYT